MLCPKCKTNKIDGRTEKICKQCIEKERIERKLAQSRWETQEAFVVETANALIDEYEIQRCMNKLRDIPFHQLFTKLVVYELLATHTTKYDGNGEVIVDMYDLIKAIEVLEGPSSGVDHLVYTIERAVERIMSDRFLL